MGRALGPESSASASGVYSATSCLHVQRQVAFPLWASAFSSVKWALLPAWPTSQMVAALNLRVGVQMLWRLSRAKYQVAQADPPQHSVTGSSPPHWQVA